MTEDSSDESEEEDSSDESGKEDSALLTRLKSKVIWDEDGRAHITVPATGPSVVFYKSNRAKPSSISRHVEDILTLLDAF